MHISLAVASLLIAAAPVLAAEPEIVGGDWLVIEGVDRRGRAPFNPDALQRRYLLDRDAVPPVEGEQVAGTKDEPGVWKRVTADEKGAVGEGRVALAYRAVESDRDRIVLAESRRGGSIIVNGTPYVGDVYGGGMGPVPVALRKGVNHVYVRGVRGKFTLTLTEPEAPLVLTGRDTTAPDLVPGAGLQGSEAAVVVANCSHDWMTVTMLEEGVEKVSLPVRVIAERDRDENVLTTEGTVDVRVRSSDKSHLRTFRSAIDGSVQEYGVRASADGDTSQLVLSIHGAGVGARGQANAYSSRPGGRPRHVAPGGQRSRRLRRHRPQRRLVPVRPLRRASRSGAEGAVVRRGRGVRHDVADRQPRPDPGVRPARDEGRQRSAVGGRAHAEGAARERRQPAGALPGGRRPLVER
jgi:hypothetical protein